jgi:hypothetical protein
MPEYREFKLKSLFNWQPQKEVLVLDVPNYEVADGEFYPYYGQSTTNKGFICNLRLTENLLNNKEGKPTILVHSNNQNVVYLDTPFYLKDGHGATSVLQADFLNRETALFIIAAIRKAIVSRDSYNEKTTKIVLKNTFVFLPVNKNGEPDYNYMETYILELEAARIRELEAARIRMLKDYLMVTGLSDYALTKEDFQFMESQGVRQYIIFNLAKLFGKSTRGKRLKGDDRIAGDLPFVTAGEADTGISAYIGNDVEIFQPNTITIDMFGSAKYRNYRYGADDHVTVVHTEKLNKNAVVFITAAINKVSHNSYWDYSNNFYAKDADALNISLPVDSNGNPDYNYMSHYIHIQHKLVIKNVVECKDREIAAYRAVVAG